MKNDLVNEEYCPYCKRHCPLSNPHCKKGMTLAQEKQRAVKKQKAALTDQSPETMKNLYTENVITESNDGGALILDTEEWNRIQAEIKLLHLLKNCYHLLPYKKGDKQVKNMNKFYVLAILREKGELTQKELEDYFELSSDILEKLLHKMKKKGYINWKQADVEGTKISLTESGLESARTYILERGKDRSDFFSTLNEEEKENLELILKKLLQDVDINQI